MDLSMDPGSVRERGSVGIENFVYNAKGTVGMAYRKLAQKRREGYIREYQLQHFVFGIAMSHERHVGVAQSNAKQCSCFNAAVVQRQPVQLFQCMLAIAVRRH